MPLRVYKGSVFNAWHGLPVFNGQWSMVNGQCSVFNAWHGLSVVNDSRFYS